jgi:Ca-activated chloride channel homolog
MRFFRGFALSLATIFCLSSFIIPAQAQETNRTPEKSSQARIVRLNVIVTDAEGRAVTDLRREEFRVTEDGKPQALTHFSVEELPASYGLVVDCSGSMRALLNHLIEAGRNIVSHNKPVDETFVMRFVDTENIQIEQGFTSNRPALEEALDNLYVEGGTTAVIDAVYRSIDFLKKNSRTSAEGARRRQAIVLISDGEDRGSRARNQEALLNRLREEDVQFFIIGLSRISSVQGSREKAMGFLARIAEASGGRAFFPKSAAEIPGVAEEIARDLHTQYTLGYTPANASSDGSFRKIQVTVPDTGSHRKLKVIARPGYTSAALKPDEIKVKQP